MEVIESLIDVVSEHWDALKEAIKKCCADFNEESLHEVAEALGIDKYNQYDWAYATGAFVFEVIVGVALFLLTGGTATIAQATTRTAKLIQLMRVIAVEAFNTATLGIVGLVNLIRHAIVGFIKAAMKGMKGVATYIKQLRKGEVIFNDLDEVVVTSARSISLKPNQVRTFSGEIIDCNEVNKKVLEKLLTKALYRNRLAKITDLKILEKNGSFFIKYKDELLHQGYEFDVKMFSEGVLKEIETKASKNLDDLHRLEILRRTDPKKYWEQLVYSDLFPPPAPPRKPCFVETTAVAAIRGGGRVELVRVGDLLWTYNFEKKEIEEKKVTQVYQNYADKYIRITLWNFEIIEVTGQHLFWIEDKQAWVKARDLQVNMMLFSTNPLTSWKKKAKIRRVKIVEERVKTYNFDVEDNHNYLVQDMMCILVHNGNKELSFSSTKKFKVNFYAIPNSKGEHLYIGKTMQKIENRFKQHLSDKVKKADWIKLMHPPLDLRPGQTLYLTPYETAVWETYEINLRGGVKAHLKNKQTPIGLKKFIDFKNGFNPCKF